MVRNLYDNELKLRDLKKKFLHTRSILIQNNLGLVEFTIRRTYYKHVDKKTDRMHGFDFWDLR